MNKELFPHGRFLISSPAAAYNVVYKINDWMKPEKNPVDILKAIAQWQELRNTLSRLGAYTEIISVPHPDGVFSANAGLVSARKFIVSTFKHQERQKEEQYWLNWARNVKNPDNPTANLFQTVYFINNEPFEGAGDALFVEDMLVCGHGFRSSRAAINQVAVIMGISCEVMPVRLTNPKFYHLDTCFCPLSGKEVLYVPSAFANPKEIEDTFDAIPVSQADANYFACNSVVLGKDVIIPARCNHTMNLLRGRGYECHPVEMSEYLKSGGACKCLTLRYF